MRNLFLFKIWALSLLLLSCNRTIDPIPPHLNTIFPTEEGKYRIYYVTDSSYASTNPLAVSTYFQKETQEGSETDLLGRMVQTVRIDQSPDSLGPSTSPLYDWKFTALWTQYLDEFYAERIEGNVRYLPLKLPPVKDISWNGNLYNGADTETYRYLSLDTTIVIQGQTYPHCVFVLQIPYSQSMPIPNNLYFSIHYAYEIYAPGIGKIARYRKQYVVQNGRPEGNSRVYSEELVAHN